MVAVTLSAFLVLTVSLASMWLEHGEGSVRFSLHLTPTIFTQDMSTMSDTSYSVCSASQERDLCRATVRSSGKAHSPLPVIVPHAVPPQQEVSSSAWFPLDSSSLLAFHGVKIQSALYSEIHGHLRVTITEKKGHVSTQSRVFVRR